MAKIGKTGRHTQAKKAERQTIRRHESNHARLGVLKSAAHKVIQAVAKKDADAANKYLAAAFSAFDKAALKRIIHPNSAARHKARLAVKVRALSAKS